MKANAHTLSWCSYLKEILTAPQINWAITRSEKTYRAPTISRPGEIKNSIWAQQVNEKEWDRFPTPDHEIYHLMYSPRKWFRNTEGKEFCSHLSRMYWRVSAIPACSSPMRDGWKIISGARILSVPTNSWWYAAKLNTGFKNPRFRRYF